MFTLMHVEEIKVNWNSFIKMKNRNYLDDYAVIKKIGRGGFGVVSKVKSIHTDVFRAAKVIRKNELNPQDHQKLLD
jgi:calcium-dependent protein kinase